MLYATIQTWSCFTWFSFTACAIHCHTLCAGTMLLGLQHVCILCRFLCDQCGIMFAGLSLSISPLGAKAYIVFQEGTFCCMQRGDKWAESQHMHCPRISIYIALDVGSHVVVYQSPATHSATGQMQDNPRVGQQLIK